MTARGLLITGTDTGVGKTHVACAVARGLAVVGRRVGVIKPAETGVGERGPSGFPPGSDAERLAAASGCTAPPDVVLPFAFPLPAAPSVSARHAGARIDLDVVERAYRALADDHDVVLVEGAGGATVTLVDDVNFLDLAARLGLAVLVVARTGLGTLNHSRLTELAVRAAGLPLIGFVLSNPDGEVSETDRANLEEFGRIMQAPVFAELPHAATVDPALEAALARQVWERLSKAG